MIMINIKKIVSKISLYNHCIVRPLTTEEIIEQTCKQAFEEFLHLPLKDRLTISEKAKILELFKNII